MRRHSILAACVAALLASTAPAAAFESGWSIFGPRPAVQPLDVPKPKVIDRGARKAAKARQLSKEVRTGAEKPPSGPLHIVISIRKQQMAVYSGGQLVARSPVSTGVPGHPTPQGVFSVIEKQIYHESNLYSSAPMPFMQRITWSGVAMHQGVVPGHPASHGCIRLPAAFAKRMWGMTKVGARVIIAQDEIALHDISSGRLFTSLPQNLSEAPLPFPARVRLADNSGVTDTPLKGSIDASEARVEQAIDQAAQASAVEPEDVVAEFAAQKTAADIAVETSIDAMVQAGIDGVTTGSVAAPVLPPEQRSPVFAKGKLAETAKDPMLKPGPISVYISRKLGKLFVRKGFSEVFETPVTIAQPDRPLGTHIFTALEANRDGTMRWNVASLPTEQVAKKGRYIMTITARGEKLRKQLEAPTHDVQQPGDPASALDRITIPDDAIARITALMTSGASLIISDLGMSHETGRGTDFIVLTR